MTFFIHTYIPPSWGMGSEQLIIEGMKSHMRKFFNKGLNTKDLITKVYKDNSEKESKKFTENLIPVFEIEKSALKVGK